MTSFLVSPRSPADRGETNQRRVGRRLQREQRRRIRLARYQIGAGQPIMEGAVGEAEGQADIER